MAHGPKGRPQILVVEDDPDAREALIDVLEISGYSAEPAGNGREAIDLLRRSSLPSLIILDLQMPVMNGWEFRAAQKKDPKLARCTGGRGDRFCRRGHRRERDVGQADRRAAPLEHREQVCQT